MTTAVTTVKMELSTLCDEYLQTLKSSLDEVVEEKREAKEVNVKMTEELKTAYSPISALEMFNRRDNLIIAWLSLRPHSATTSATTNDLEDEAELQIVRATEKAVRHLCNTQQRLNLSPSFILTAHRLKHRSGPKNALSLIVRFATRKACDLVYQSRLELKKQLGDIMCINEDLPKEISYSFSQARKLCTSKKSHGAWTNSAVLYIQCSDETNYEPKKIYC